MNKINEPHTCTPTYSMHIFTLSHLYTVQCRHSHVQYICSIHVYINIHMHKVCCIRYVVCIFNVLSTCLFSCFFYPNLKVKFNLLPFFFLHIFSNLYCIHIVCIICSHLFQYWEGVSFGRDTKPQACLTLLTFDTLVSTYMFMWQEEVR